MNIAIISDIHGNSVALDAVLRSAQKNKVDKLLVLGDLVGYYYNPEEVLSMLDAWDCTIIKGNHERILEDVIDGLANELKIKEKYGSAHYKASSELSATRLKQLRDLPETVSVSIPDVEILLCHGAPWDADCYLYPDTPKNVLDKAAVTGVDFVFVGHSHYPFTYRTASGLLVNTGSVGQSRRVGGIADWAMLNTASRSVTPMATPYDVRSVVQDVERFDPQVAYLKDVLNRNR